MNIFLRSHLVAFLFLGTLYSSMPPLTKKARITKAEDTSPSQVPLSKRFIEALALDNQAERIKKLKEIFAHTVSTSNPLHTIIQIAASVDFDFDEVLALYMGANLPISSADDERKTPLDLAIALNLPKVIKALLGKGNSFDRPRALRTAIQLNLPDIVKLIAQKDDYFRKSGNSYGETALMLAASLDRSECIEVLISFGADLLKECPSTEETALHVAARNGHVRSTSILANQSFIAYDRLLRQTGNAIEELEKNLRLLNPQARLTVQAENNAHEASKETLQALSTTCFSSMLHDVRKPFASLPHMEMSRLVREKHKKFCLDRTKELFNSVLRITSLSQPIKDLLNPESIEELHSKGIVQVLGSE